MKSEESLGQERRVQDEAESRESLGRDDEKHDGKRYWEFSQSRTAIIIAIGIIFVLDLLNIILTALPGEIPDGAYLSSPFALAFAVIFDIFLCINILRGKNWARIWMLVRIVVGMVIFGGITLIQGNIGEVTITIGLSLTLILLLTGTSTRLRIIGSIVLAVLAILGGLILTMTTDSMLELPTVPETPTPDYFSTYTSEGFFSISYPPDWNPEMSILEEAEQEMKQWAKSEGLESQAAEAQLVFSAWKTTQDEFPPSVLVQVQPRSIWSLDAIVEADRQIGMEQLEQYVERSMVRTTIGGREAIILVLQYEMSEYGVPMSTSAIAYIGGDEFVWVVVCMCDTQDSDVYLDTFDDIVRSLRVEY